MSKQRAVAIWMAVGAVSLMSACVATVDEPVMEAEPVDVAEDALIPIEPSFRDPRTYRPRALPPDWRRALRCLPNAHKNYVSRDPDVCAAIRFYCVAGTPFFDDCGCGCNLEGSSE